MGKLEIIFNKQKELQDKLAPDRKTNGINRQRYINQMILGLHEETTEIMRCTAYKNPTYVKYGWKKTQNNDFNHMREEIVDAMHFLVNLAEAIDMTAEEFFEVYCKKHNINHERQENNY